LVGVDLTGSFNCLDIYHVGSSFPFAGAFSLEVDKFCMLLGCMGCCREKSPGMRFFLLYGRGPYIFELLLLMAFDGGGQLGEVFLLDKVLAEARPNDEKSIFNGFEPTRSGGAIATFV
jgi:hypothetical protein